MMMLIMHNSCQNSIFINLAIQKRYFGNGVIVDFYLYNAGAEVNFPCLLF
jgi:hypothetical protein